MHSWRFILRLSLHLDVSPVKIATLVQLFTCRFKTLMKMDSKIQNLFILKLCAA